MKKNETSVLVSYLDELFPNPRCELNYSKDYELVIAVMLSAQTTDKRVNSVTSILFKKYPSLDTLKNASIKDIETIIKPIGTYSRKALYVHEIASKLVNDKHYTIPNDRSYLESLPGVGRKTTNVVLANLFDEPCMAVDTHVARVSKRLKLASKNDDVLTIEKKLYSKLPMDKIGRLHHQLVLFGRYYCKAINPMCDTCKLKDYCIEKRK